MFPPMMKPKGPAIPPMDGPPDPGMGGPALGLPPMGGPGGNDPMAGMLPPPPPMPGGGGGPQLPVGGSMPGPDDDMSDSPLLSALSASMSGGGMGGYPSGTSLGGIGQQDPNMGIEQMLQMLALGDAGVGGTPGGGPGRSGLDPGQSSHAMGAY